MIDLHTHTFFSDGGLIPSELIQRARKKGHRAIAVTDHADSSNIEQLIKAIKKVCFDTNRAYKDIICIPGVELTHIPPALVNSLTKKARKLGAKIVVFHGETTVEPVEPGSNTAAIKAKVDILAHPGKITGKDAALAAKKGVCLEITARRGHKNTNRHVARAALKAGAKLVFDTDTHMPEDLADKNIRKKILTAAGLKPAEIKKAIINSENIVKRATGKKI